MLRIWFVRVDDPSHIITVFSQYSATPRRMVNLTKNMEIKYVDHFGN